MPNRLTILLIGLSLVLFMRNAVRAESTHERVALMLSGSDCASSQQQIVSALEQQTGVLRADQDLMPDHVLVDIVRQQVTEETVAAIANAAIGGGQCRAEIMKSCITAELPSHDTDPPRPAYRQAHSH
jgi:cation transport ATPase